MAVSQAYIHPADVVLSIYTEQICYYSTGEDLYSLNKYVLAY